MFRIVCTPIALFSLIYQHCYGLLSRISHSARVYMRHKSESISVRRLQRRQILYRAATEVGDHIFFFFIISVNIWIKPTHSTAQNVCILRIASVAYVKFQCSWYTLLYIRRVHCCVRRISQAQCGRCWAVMSSYRDVYYVHLGYQFLWAEHHRFTQLTLSAVTGMASVTAKLLNNKIEKNSRRRPTKKKLYSQIHICKPMRIVVS